MRRLMGAAVLLVLAAGLLHAEVPIERPGRVERVPEPLGPHWVWASDVLLRRSALLDLDRGAFVGMISTGYLSPWAAFARSRREFYLPETYYSRGSRGVRTDVVTIYDATSLAPAGEVVIPPKRAINVLPSANAALSDDDRFLAVFNMTPATSLSVVDLERREFAGEITTPGCSLVYAAGPRRFLTICADGSLLTVTLDERGREASKRRSEPFFDPEADPVTEKAVRYGDLWLFVSFEGYVHPVDVSGDEPRAGERWSLIDDEGRRRSWRVGGSQHLAVHEPTGRLYSLMHRGGADTHKSPGFELWVYDLETRQRIQRIALRHPGLAFLSETVAFGQSWIWPFHRLWDFLLDHVVPNPGLNQVQVTQDDAPLLITGSRFGGSLAVYDALSGEFLRRVSSGNLTIHALQAPWGGRGQVR
ncbi:MAG: amine dehydrogenase large subunit [Myxococcota bacterium]